MLSSHISNCWNDPSFERNFIVKSFKVTLKAVYMQLDHALQTVAFPDKNLWQENCKHIMDLLTEWTKLDIQCIKLLILIRALLFIWIFPVSLKPYLHSIASIFDATTYQDNYFHSAWHFLVNKSPHKTLTVNGDSVIYCVNWIIYITYINKFIIYKH
jgi:hypothetical protein